MKGAILIELLQAGFWAIVVAVAMIYAVDFSINAGMLADCVTSLAEADLLRSHGCQSKSHCRYTPNCQATVGLRMG